jgi:hypothetical protein
MNREARIYLLCVDAKERRLLMQLPDATLDTVEKVKRIFGKESRVITTMSTRKASAGDGQQKLL